MKKIILSLVMLASAAIAQADVIGSVKTATRILGPNNAVVVESIKDSDVSGVTCHISYAKTGGISGAIGIAEDPSKFSIACRQTGPLVISKAAQQQSVIQAFDRNVFFKTMLVTRMYDAPNQTLIYVITSKKLIDGSPFNAISSIPLMPWGQATPVIQ